VRAVAEGRVSRTLAATPRDRFRSLDGDLQRGELAACVGTIAVGLAFGPTATAPPLLARFLLLDIRAVLGAFGFGGHGILSGYEDGGNVYDFQ
jgi:hypothetical protein